MSHLTLRQLKVFESVARNLSYTRAAAELHLSQPAVSMQIKQLEANVGLPLFERLGKRVYLTEAGAELLRYARGVLQSLSEAEQVLNELKGVAGGRLRIAVASTVNYFATRLLGSFCGRYADIQIILEVTNRQRLLKLLQGNGADILLMGRPPPGLDVVAEPFMENPLVVIAAPGHPLTRDAAIPLAALRDQTFLLREQGSGTRIAMERFLAERGVSVTSSMEMNSNEAIKQGVQAGLGLGVVSAHTLDMELELGRLVTLDVESFPILRQWYLVHRRGKRLSSAARAFRDFVLGQAPSTDERRAPGEAEEAAPGPISASSRRVPGPPPPAPAGRSGAA